MIYLTQWLCPSRHCAYAIPWDDAKTTAEQVVRDGEDLARGAGVNPRCGICGGAIAPEARPTGFPTIAAAMAALVAAEREQIRSRRLLDQHGLSRERLFPPL